MLHMNLQTFGGRGNSGTARDNSGSKVTRNVTDAKNQNELNAKLKERGLVLDAAYQKASNGEEVVMYKMNADGTIDKRYVGTYNQYFDGGREIVNIKERPLISEVSIGGKTYTVDKNNNWKEKGAKSSSKSEGTNKKGTATNNSISSAKVSASGVMPENIKASSESEAVKLFNQANSNKYKITYKKGSYVVQPIVNGKVGPVTNKVILYRKKNGNWAFTE